MANPPKMFKFIHFFYGMRLLPRAVKREEMEGVGTSAEIGMQIKNEWGEK